MPRLAANLSMLFKEVDFLERFAAARKAGFRAVEYQYPYKFSAQDVAAAARDAGVQVVLHNVPPGAERAELHATYVANLRYAAKRLQQQGMRLLVEPLSPGTAANYFLNGSAQAVRVLEEVAADNAFLQYDVFHMQMMEGNLALTIARALPRVGHVQIADVPGRHEPGSGEINFGFLLPHIDALGYAGWIGCEYNPQGDTLEGLKWARRYLNLNRGSAR